MKKVRFSKAQIGMMVALPVAITMNPLTIEIFLDYIKWGFAGLSAIAVTYIILFTLYMCFKPQQNNIPDSTKKDKKLPKQMQYEV